MLKSEIIAQMPKVELHCHLDGSLSLSCIKELAKNAGVNITMTDEEILERHKPQKIPKIYWNI